MAKSSLHTCENCQYETVGYYGMCPNCSGFDTLKPKESYDSKRKKTKENRTTEIKQLKTVELSNSDRIITNLEEFNRVMGGGIVKDSVSIISARPGAGKSTLLLQVSNDIASKGKKVLYASGEESESQIRRRADRILGEISENIWMLSTNSMDQVLENIIELNADFIIIDSIQTFTLENYPNSRAGSPTQTIECAAELIKVAKKGSSPRAVMLIGQMTKEDEIAGVRALEHLVDTVLIISGESGEELRSLVATKNRYGSTGEIGFFNMTEKGLLSIDNPSSYFITDRKSETTIPGSALTVVREGTRSIILEIESLVSVSYSPYPIRIGECMRKDQLNTLISIIEQRIGLKFFDKNVVIKTTGGIKLFEQGTNLASLMSIVSSFNGKGIDNDIAFIADVGLTGELKKVPSIESRIKELDRMGYKKVYIAKLGNTLNVKNIGIEILERNLVQDIIREVFN